MVKYLKFTKIKISLSFTDSFFSNQKNPSVLNHLLTDDINMWYLRCMQQLLHCSALQFQAQNPRETQYKQVL